MKKNPYIAPIVVSILIVLYAAGMLALFLLVPGIPLLVRILLGISPLICGGVILFVLIQRIGELRSGEEDDLDRY